MVQQTALRQGKNPRCTSTSTWSSPWNEQKVMWKWDTCIATREQLKFVSPDGKRVLVIDPRPASLQARGEGKDVEMATLYEHGVRVKGAKAGALLPLLPLRIRYTSDGKAVELETEDGHPLRLGFDGEGFPIALEEKQAFTASAGLYQYEDEKRTVHVVSSLSEVPDRYRSQARPVEAQVLTVSGPLGLGGPPPPEPTPEPPSPPDADKNPGPDHSLEKARLASPAELLQRARDTAKQLEEVQRTREKLADSLLSESPAGQPPPPSSSPSAPDTGKNPIPEGPLEKARIPSPAELLERAREAVKKAEQSQRQREMLPP